MLLAVGLFVDMTPAVPFFVAMILALLAITCRPPLTLALPRWFGLM